MLTTMFLFLYILIICTFAKHVPLSIDDIPNPMISPELCGRSGISKSVICDIHELLSVDDKNVLEGVMNEIKDIEIAVAIISETNTNLFESNESVAHKYATALHNAWGVGDKDLNNGVLIFVAIDDRTMFISVGDGIQKQFTDWKIWESNRVWYCRN